MPHTRRPIRITPIQRLMGEASNGDVARVGFGDDYSAVLQGEAEIKGQACLKILLTSRKESSTYHKIIIYVRKTDWRPVQADFFLISGKHFKSAVYESFRPLDGRIILTQMTIFDTVRNGRKTTFIYEKIEKKQLPLKYFNKNYLIHIRGLGR